MTRGAIAGLLGVVVLAVAAWTAGHRLWFAELAEPDALNQAQIARSLATGKGFTTNVVTPLELVFVPQVNPHPDIMTPPLGPLWTSLLFRLFGASDRVAAAGSGVAFVLTVAALYWLGLRVGSRSVAVLVACLYAVTYPSLRLALYGGPVPLAALLVTLALVALSYVPVRRRGEEDATWACSALPALAIVGVAVGLASMVEYYLLPLALAALVAARGPTRRDTLLAVACLAAGLLVVLLPWFARQWRVTGTPAFSPRSYELAANVWHYPGRSIHRNLDRYIGSPVATTVSHWRELPRKWGLGLAAMREGLWRGADVVLAALFVGSLLIPTRQHGPDRLCLAVLVGALAVSAAGCLFTPSVTLVAAIYPPMAAFGLLRVLGRVPGSGRTPQAGLWPPSRRTLTAAGLSVLVAWPTFAALFGTRTAEPADQPALDYLASALPSGAVVMTDSPWQVAWRTRCTAVELCNTEVQFNMIDAVLGVDAIYLSGAFRALPLREHSPEHRRGDWWDLAYSDTPSYLGFQQVADMPTGEVLRRPMSDLPPGPEGAAPQ